MLYTEPSFSIYADEDGSLENEKGDLEIRKSPDIGEGMNNDEFSFVKKGMGLIVEDDEDDRDVTGFKNLVLGENDEKEDEPRSPLPMYLATGFGIEGLGELETTSFDDVEEYYKKMVAEYPSNPLFLRNYAQLLQSKGDLTGAEECYFSATLADPEDGEILMQYAKLIWELHHDQDRALSYFESAARAAPHDCNVLAAYASFLWEIDDKEENDEDTPCGGVIQNPLEVEERPPLHWTGGLGVNVGGVGDSFDYAIEGYGVDGKLEEYYKKIVDENPCNPLVLRNYAYFLQQTKGDLQGAEEYYSRAILTHPGDGEVISQYAQLVWELHHDQDKASCYFEQAVQAAPADSHVLAAYAKFLWEAEDEEDSGNLIQLPVLQGAVTSA